MTTLRLRSQKPDRRSLFRNLLFRREGPHFHAFDVLSIEGKVRGLPLLNRSSGDRCGQNESRLARPCCTNATF